MTELYLTSLHNTSLYFIALYFSGLTQMQPNECKDKHKYCYSNANH